MTQAKIQEKFYPLTNGITSILRQAKLTAAEWRIWSYLVELDPWGDRYADFDYLSVISACGCSKSSFYRAIAKFQELKIFDFQSNGLSLRNLFGTSQIRKPETEPEPNPPKSDSIPSPKPKPKTKEPPILRQDRPESPQPPVTNDLPSPPTNDYPEISDPWDDRIETNDLEEISEAARHNTPVPDLGNESQNWESSLKIGKTVPELGKQSQNWENEGLKPLSDIQSASPQTIQKKLDPPVQPDRGEEQINFKDEEVKQSEQVAPKNENLTQNEQVESKESKAQNESIKANETTLETREKKDVPRAVTQNKTEIIREPKKNLRKKIDKSELPNDLINWLEELGIPLDDKVLNAIASHDISQAYGACRHVEETWETINNPRGVFLFQLPKQKIEKLGAQLPEIGPKMREEYAAIEEEMASDEYKAKSQEMFAKLRAKLGKKGQKK